MRRFGARGNGRTDDSAAFSRALGTAQPGDTVYARPGHYVLTRSLALPSGVVLLGAGDRTRLDWGDFAGYGIVSGDTVGSRIESMAVLGASRWRVVLERAREASVIGCLIARSARSADAAAGGVLVTASHGVLLRANRFAGNGRPGRPGLSDIQINGLGQGVSSRVELLRNRCASRDVEFNICCFDAHHLRIAENEIAGARTGPGDNGGYGIVVYATATFPGSCHDVAVTDNRVEDTEGSGIYFVRVTDAHIEGNAVRRVAIKQSDRTLPTGGVSLNESARTTVAANSIEDVGGAGVVVSVPAPQRTAVRVDSNTISGAERAGVQLRGEVDDITISRNAVSGAPRGIVAMPGFATARVTIEDNQVRGRGDGDAGIVLPDVRSARVAANRIFDVDDPAIDLVDTDGGAHVVGNRVWRGSLELGAGSVRVRRR